MKFLANYKKFSALLMLALVMTTTLGLPLRQANAYDVDSSDVRRVGNLGIFGKILEGAAGGAATGGTIGITTGVVGGPVGSAAAGGAGALIGGLVGGAVGGIKGLFSTDYLLTQATADAMDGNPSWYTKTAVSVITGIARGFLSTAMVFGADMLGKVIDMNFNTKYSEVKAIQVGWGIIRDFINMFFIFILLYVAISTILQYGNTNAKSMVTEIIIAAILVNFSMLMTSLLIDASNIISLEFYNKITANSTRTVSDVVLGGIKIVEGITKGEAVKSDPNTELVRTMFIVVFLYFLARFFLMGAMMFIGRAVMFAFLLMFSPFAVMGSILPQTKQYASEWWKNMSGQLLFGPFYLFILYFTTLLIYSSEGAKFVVLTSGKSGADASIFDQLAGYINYIIIVGVLTIGLNKAKEFSGEIGNMLVGASQTAAGYVAGAIGGSVGSFFGGVGAAGRSTVGFAANRMTDPTALASYIQAGNAPGASAFARSRAAMANSVVNNRASAATARYLSTATFDPRNATGVNNVAGGINRGLGFATGSAGLNVGQAGGAGGYTAERQTRTATAQATASAQRGQTAVPLADQELQAALATGFAPLLGIRNVFDGFDYRRTAPMPGGRLSANDVSRLPFNTILGILNNPRNTLVAGGYPDTANLFTPAMLNAMTTTYSQAQRDQIRNIIDPNTANPPIANTIQAWVRNSMTF